jgi:hypothetical protein
LKYKYDKYLKYPSFSFQPSSCNLFLKFYFDKFDEYLKYYEHMKYSSSFSLSPFSFNFFWGNEFSLYIILKYNGYMKYISPFHFDLNNQYLKRYSFSLQHYTFNLKPHLQSITFNFNHSLKMRMI